MTFFVGGGIGHCGTKWLAQVLNRDDVRVHHQLKHTHANRKPWDAWIKIEAEQGLGGDLFQGYWDIINHELAAYRVVGDMCSWMPLHIPMVAQHIEIGCIVYLVRNGIQQLHSAAYYSLIRNFKPDHWWFSDYLREYWEIANAPHKPWKDWTRWDKLCLWWQLNAFMPDWLRKQPRLRDTADVTVYRTEDLTQDAGTLAELVGSFGLRIPMSELEALQQKDVNRKVKGDRSPEALWQKWTQEQQEAFRRICGPGMKQYGYEVPE